MDLQVKKEYMIFDITRASTRDGRPFIKMVLSDNTGTLINSIMFDSNRLDFEPKKGDTVSVSAALQQYNNQSQLKVAEMALVSSGGSEAFLPKSKQDPNQMQVDLKHLTGKHVTSVEMAALVEAFYNDSDVYGRFINMPAAKTVHHACLHGLLEHTLSVVRGAVAASTLYPGLNKELLIVGALFHDIGKVLELDTSVGFDYTDDGRFLGHIMLGYKLVDKYMSGIDGFSEAIKKQLSHIIVSHHGCMEFGSPQVPKTAEAVVIHHIDDMDAKLNNFSSVLDREDVPQGEWSSYDRLLERQIYRPAGK